MLFDFNIISSKGDPHLGGDDFDNRLVDYVIDEIKKHAFFKDIDFKALEAKKIEAPFKPVLEGSLDVRNFDEEFTSEDLVSSEIPEKNMELIKKNQEKFEEFDDDEDD